MGRGQSPIHKLWLESPILQRWWKYKSSYKAELEKARALQGLKTQKEENELVEREMLELEVSILKTGKMLKQLEEEGEKIKTSREAQIEVIEEKEKHRAAVDARLSQKSDSEFPLRSIEDNPASEVDAQ